MMAGSPVLSETRGLILFSRSTMPNLALKYSHSVWMHFDDTFNPSYSDVSSIISEKCVHVFITGSTSESIHDIVDDILDERGQIGTTTTWSNDCLDDLAWDFLNVAYNEGDDIKLAVAFSSNADREVVLLLNMARSMMNSFEEEM